MAHYYEPGTRVLIEQLLSMPCASDFERFIDNTNPNMTAAEAKEYFAPFKSYKMNAHLEFNWETVAECIRMLHE